MSNFQEFRSNVKVLTLDQTAEHLKLAANEVVEYVASGVLKPLNDGPVEELLFDIRHVADLFENLPVSIPESTPFTKPPKLTDATVAIVTTAALHAPGERGWTWGDNSFRILQGHHRNFRLGHLSSNFDRSGVAADLNVVLPLDRLAEMARVGMVKAVGPRHLSFMGGSGYQTISTIRLDTGPAAAKVLLDDGVDVVLLTPV